MEQSQHVNIAARIQQLIVSRHINKQETKIKKQKVQLTNTIYNKYNEESLFVLSPRETQIRKLEEQNKYLEKYLNRVLRERKPFTLKTSTPCQKMGSCLHFTDLEKKNSKKALCTNVGARGPHVCTEPDFQLFPS